MNKWINYFFRGLLFVVPVSLTIYILLVSIQWLDGLIPLNIPGLGLITIVLMVTLIGYLGSTLLIRPVFKLFENLMVKVPLVNYIYSSLKDLMGAFVGEKKKFNRPVLVTLDPQNNIQKPGFITQDDLSELGIMGQVAVYLPHSYNFSGNMFIVPAHLVTPIKASGSNIMKFIVSGGVSGIKYNE